MDPLEWTAAQIVRPPCPPSESELASTRKAYQELSARILYALQSGGPMTARELAERLQRSSDAVKGQLVHLRNAGLAQSTRGPGPHDLLTWEATSPDANSQN